MSLANLWPQLDFGGANRKPSRDGLVEVPGIEIHDACHATWWVEGVSLEVTRDAVDDRRITLRSPSLPSLVSSPASVSSPRAALEASARMTINARWAYERGERFLIADIPSVLGNALPEVFQELAASVRASQRLDATVEVNNENEGATSAEVARSDSAPIDKTRVREVLRAPWWDEQSIVERTEGWELRPVVAGHPIPVFLDVTRGRVRCWREATSSLGNATVSHAICLQALRFNRQFKHARLTCLQGTLVAESLLPERLVTGETLAVIARAVALVEHRVRTTLSILREHQEIAALFAALFAAPDLPSDPQAAVDLERGPQKGGN